MSAARLVVDEGALRLDACNSMDFCSILEERGYLEGGVVYPLEAAYQASRGRVEIVAGDKILTGWEAFFYIIGMFRVQLKVAIAYRILRSKYSEVKLWTRPSTLVARRRSGRTVEVLVLEEGESIKVADLAEWSTAAVKDGHDPVVAIVDRNGQVTFYEARSVTQIV
ncbi:MAG: hypothetical protein LRS46_00570 [Desulfurococcales archaeon]|nr:hypothetical protein [Desulfurococcales archaeon]